MIVKTNGNGHFHNFDGDHRFEGKSPAEIQRELERTRAEMAVTIQQLENDLSPGQLFDRALSLAKDNGATEFLDNLWLSVRSNPLPVALVGVGIVWLAQASASSARSVHYGHTPSTGDRLRSRAGSAMSSMREGVEDVKDELHGMKSRISSSMSHASDEASDVVERGRIRAEELELRTRSAMHRASSRVQQTWQDQPMLIGALAIAAGAALAALIPETRTENRRLGPARDRIVEEGERIGRSALHGAKAEARREASDQGLDRGNLGDQARDIASRAAQVARSAVSGATESVRRETAGDLGHSSADGDPWRDV